MTDRAEVSQVSFSYDGNRMPVSHRHRLEEPG